MYSPAEIYFNRLLELADLSKSKDIQTGLDQLDFLSRQPSVAYYTVHRIDKSQLDTPVYFK